MSRGCPRSLWGGVKILSLAHDSPNEHNYVAHFPSSINLILLPTSSFTPMVPSMGINSFIPTFCSVSMTQRCQNNSPHLLVLVLVNDFYQHGALLELVKSVRATGCNQSWYSPFTIVVIHTSKCGWAISSMHSFMQTSRL
jgi:hypothetical protein